MKSETLRRMWALCAGALIFAVGHAAQAQDASADECQVDTDCPGDKSCGGPVCDWYVSPAGHKCVPAGSKKAGSDGWCNGAATDCKCMAEGAKCVGVGCTFTVKPAGGTGGSSGGTGGSAGTGGTDSTGSAGTATAAAPPADSGGCAIASIPAAGLGSAGLLVGLGAIAFGARRRRRAA